MSNIEKLKEQLDNNLKPQDLINETIKKAKILQKDYNLFVTILDNATINSIESPISNIPFATKDNFSTKDILTTASSNTLKNYVPIFDATVISRLKELGAINIGKTVLDELGMGGTGLTGHTGIVRNPYDNKRIAGGSSAGSAVSVATNLVSFALGSDTGDSIRKPAAYCGIVGYKPTYGILSRYGLIPFASSLDHVGVLTNYVKDAALVVNLIKGKDQNDMTTFDSSNIDLLSNITDEIKQKKLFYIKELCEIDSYSNPSNELRENLNLFHSTLNKIKDLGVLIEPVSIEMNLLKALKPAYDCISSAEATSNNSNLTGIIFGPRGEGSTTEEMMIFHRTKGFSPLIKRRFVIGSYVLQKENQEKYFLNACRVRRLIVNKMNEYFSIYDALIMPSSGHTAPLISEASDEISSEQTPLENHLVIGNFGGFPSISIPTALINNLPIGINLTGKIMDDANILNIAYKIEKIIKFKEEE